MQTLLLLLSLLFLPGGEPVSAEFSFKQMKAGKPPLKMFYYDVSIENKTGKSLFLAIPRWFESRLIPEDKVWGAQYDEFGELKGATLFSGVSFTIFLLAPKQKFTISNFEIQSNNEDLLSLDEFELPLRVAPDITVGEHSLSHFMDDKEHQDDELPYKFIDSRVIPTMIPFK